MGFKISWIGFHGLTKPEVLAMVGGVDTGVLDEANEAPFSGAEIPGGWFILFSNDFEFVTQDRLRRFSAKGALVACQVHEGVMVTFACGYENGVEQWALGHDSDNGIRDLAVSGSPPPAFEPIRDRLSKQQEAEGGESASVDYYSDIPVETAEAVCAYRHDRGKFAWGRPVFTRVDIR